MEKRPQGEEVMQDIDVRDVRLDALTCSDDFDKRLVQTHVIKLADSIRKLGLIHYPLVRMGATLEVIAGEDRVAACVLLNLDSVTCRLVSCTDAEVLELREAENRDRRNHTGTELAELVQKKLETLPPPAALTPEKHVGRPKLEKTLALEEVAEEAGISKDAARKKIERAQKKAQRAQEAGDAPEASAPPFETWGRAVDPVLLAETAEAHRALTDAASKVSTALGRLTAIQNKALIRDGLANQLAELLKEASRSLRHARPAALCAWCKGQPDLRKGCAACLGAAYLLEANMGSVPAELKYPQAIMVGGKPMALVEVTLEQAEASRNTPGVVELVPAQPSFDEALATMPSDSMLPFGGCHAPDYGEWEDDGPRQGAEPVPDHEVDMGRVLNDSDDWGDLFPEGAEEVDGPL
jgi:hypothetical protein